MRTFIKKATAGVLAAMMVATVAGCGNASTKQAAEGSTEGKELTKITFCLDWTPNTNHTGLYVAQQQGYYEAAGLDVEIVQPPEDGAYTMCAAGQAQFAIGYEDTMAAALDLDEPMGISAVAAVIQHNTSGIMARKGEGMDTPKGLEGKTYSTWDSPIELATLKKVVEDDGGDFSKVKLIPNNITDEPAALKAKQTDAIWVYKGWGGINAELSDFDYDFWYFKDINPVFDYYSPVIIANNDFMTEHADEAKAFLDATKKGYEYAIENPKEAAQALIDGDTTGSLKGSESLVQASQEYMVDQYTADASEWGVIDEKRWDAFYSWLWENKLTKHDLTGKGVWHY